MEIYHGAIEPFIYGLNDYPCAEQSLAAGPVRVLSSQSTSEVLGRAGSAGS